MITGLSQQDTYRVLTLEQYEAEFGEEDPEAEQAEAAVVSGL